MMYDCGKKLLTILLALLCANEVFAQPKADFTVSATSGCSPLTVNFTNKSTGGSGALTYSWDLGNSNISTLKDPSAIYYIAKSYKVILTATDGAGKTDTVSKIITVYAPPTAAFKTDVTSGCPPFYITFTDQSKTGSGSINGWLWDFGDGSTSNSQNPAKHQYSATGKFTISLQVTDKNGCTNAIVKQNMIVASTPPTVDFSGSPLGGCSAPVSISFTPKITGTGSSFTYSWDFGDGQTSTSTNPSNTYSAAGSYSVTLKCTDNSGCAGTITKNNYVFIGKPTADFTFSPASGCSPLSVNFTDASTGSTGGSFFWNFGDGKTSTTQNPSHDFGIGTFDVKLVVKSASGCVDSIVKKKIITATKGFTPSFTADTILCSRPFTTTFKNTSGSNTQVISWDFGDGQTATTDNVSHTYTDTGGFYSVSLTVSDNTGCTQSITRKNLISTRQISAIVGYPKMEGCAPFDFVFKNNSISNDSIVSTNWDFGDGHTSTAYDPGDHVYQDTGFFKVTLTIKSKKGCKSTTTIKVSAGSHTNPDFYATPNLGCLNLLRHVKFTNLTNTKGSIKADQYFWLFGDGTSATDSTPVHRYENRPAKLDVMLVSSNKGCKDTMLKKKYMTIKGPFSKYSIKRDGCVSNIVSFFDSSINANRVEYFFGDGDSSANRNPVHTYTAGNYFPYQVVHNDTTGCSDTFYLFVPGNPLVISSPWVANFSTQALGGCLPYTVNFLLNDNDSAQNIIYFGNGDSAVVRSDNNPTQFVSYTYTKRGTFLPTLKATNNRGCVVTIKLPHKISTTGPNIGFTIAPGKGCIPLTITLTDTASPDKSIIKKTYDMGDGSILNVTSSKMTYTYTKPPQNQFGGYTILETVTDTAKCVSVFTQAVYPTYPVATFKIDTTPTCKNNIYSFTADNIGFSPFIYNWNLGNGTNSASSNINVGYGNGTYKISLKLSDINGCTDTSSKFIVVKKRFSHADFSIDSTLGNCPPFHVVFHDNSRFGYGGYKGYEWDFGDGSYHSTLANPQKVYYSAGKFTVKLKITDSLGCTDSIIKPNLVVVMGAIGDYSFDKNRGCTPVDIRFNATSKNATKFAWDLGDGQIGLGKSLTHTYTAVRTYVPLLILSDSSGCTYILPPKDTIRVDPQPTAVFNFNAICSGLPTFFSDASIAGSGTITNWIWDFGDGGTGTGKAPKHIFKKNGFYNVRLTVSTNYGCSASTIKKIKIGGITAAYTSNRVGCVGYPVSFTDKSSSDTIIKTWLWVFTNTSYPSLKPDTMKTQNPVKVFRNKGKYNISLFVSNYRGCVDTLINGYIVIGDTVAPPTPMVYRASVVDDHQVELDFSKYKDVDFYYYSILMADPSGNYIEIARDTNINDTMFVVKNLNTLQNSYCFKIQVFNACNHFSPPSPSHCTINVTAKPGPDKALVSWTPYIGWKKVYKYYIYRLNFYNNKQFNLIDSVDGSVTSYVDTKVVCFRLCTYKIKAIEDSGYNQVSWSDTSTTLPIHFNNVPAVTMIRATVPDNKRAEIDWEDFPTLKVKKWMLEKSLDGINYTLIDSPYNRNVLSVLDRKVDVQNHSYYYRLNMMDSCGDLGPYSYIGKTILLHTDTTPDVQPYLHWSMYKNWPEGVKYYEIQLKDAFGTYQYLGSTVSGNDTSYTDHNTDLNSLPEYCYRVIAHRNRPDTTASQYQKTTSMSNEACMEIKSRVFVPNVFTPNGDGKNDSFRVKGIFIRDYHIKIFDRWGTKVFESSSLKDNWDGTYKNGKPIVDAYKYIIYVRGVDNAAYFLQGWVTLLE